MIFGSYGRHSIRFKFIISNVVVQLIMLSLLVWNSIRLTQNYLVDQTAFRINELIPLLNSSIATPLIEEDIATLNDILEQIVRTNGLTYVEIKNPNGKLITKKGTRSTTEEEIVTRFDIHTLDNKNENQYVQKMEIKIGNHIVGELLFELNTAFIGLAVGNVRNQSVLIATVEIILTIIILTLLTFTLSKNLITLTNEVKKFPNKDINLKLPKNTKDEVGTLLSVIINMLKEIADRDKKLEQINNELEETVKKRTLELESSNKELESFSYSISHDLRTPLRSIGSFSTIILQDYEDKLDENGKSYLNRIVANTNHMGNLIDSLLLLSRTVKTPLKFSEFNLSEFVKHSFSQLLENEPGRKISLDVMSDFFVTADSTLIKTMIDNLIGNAWKYTGKEENATIQFGALIKNAETSYFIKDNGIGFNMKYAENIFTPFKRVHTNDDYSGTGIGLATVHKIIERHNGRIWFEAKENEGATFFFTLK